MTSPIKPPGGPRIPPPPEQGAGAPEPSPSSAGRAFTEALSEARETEGTAEARPAEGAASGAAAIADDLRAGRIDPRQAVELLVERALASPAAQALDGPGREALRAHLRTTMIDDPALSGLVQDLERSR